MPQKQWATGDASKTEQTGTAFALLLRQGDRAAGCNKVMTGGRMLDEAKDEDDPKGVTGSDSGSGA